MVAERERTACLRKADNAIKDDLQTGRRVGPMLATSGAGHFGFLHEVKGSCAQEAALSLHAGMIGSMVAAQLPPVDADGFFESGEGNSDI